MFAKKGIKLHVIISLLILFIVISTVSLNWLVSMNSHKKALTENYLDSNYNYAKKITSSTGFQLNYMQRNITALSRIDSMSTLTQEELDTWFDANYDQFNSIFITDETGTIQSISPSFSSQNVDLTIRKGTMLESDTLKRALIDRKPLISEPYIGTSGHLITLISAPIFDRQTGEYKGLVGGTINMESKNVLKNLLGSHDYENQSYVYVVDKNGKLIYHPDEERLGEDVSSNNVVQLVMERTSGASVTTNTEGIEYFAGYSFLESTGWGIVSQTPTSVMDEPLESLFWRMAIISIPFLLVILLVGGVLVSMITKPIKTLADFSEDTMNKQHGSKDLEILNIHSPIYEVQQLNHQVMDHLRILNKQARIDGLTEIPNRRTFDTIIERWIEEKVPFSLIMLDIDHFKKVNDTYGHLVGDEVLKYLSKQMVDMIGKEDLCFRYGGEEFGILVKNLGETETYGLAEKLRTAIANTVSPTGEPIKISLGITAYRETDRHSKVILNRADAALYHSKKTGRNKTTVHHDENFAQLS